MKRVGKQIAIVLWMSVIVGALGCGPRQRQITCPTARLSCPCAELEREAPEEEVATLITAVRNLSDPRLLDPSRAAEGLAVRCRDEEGLFPPRGERRDATWRARCSGVEAALPALLETLDAIESLRGSEGQSSEQSSFATSVVSAIGSIALGNPESPCRADAVRALGEVLRRPEPAQDLSVNELALAMLGELGEDETAPAMVLAMFMRSRRRALSLQEPARAALMGLRDLEQAAAALVRAGQLDDEELNELIRADSRIDARLVKEQVALALGLMGVTAPAVVGYLMEELGHTEIDDVDRSPSREGESFTPEQSAAWRRVYAAQALGRLRHGPALDMILGRLSLDTTEGRLVDPTINILEVPGYLDALGHFTSPERTTSVFVDWVVYGLDINRDHAARWLSLQGSFEQVERLEAVASALPVCPPGNSRCLRRNFEERYLPALRASSGCTSLECWVGRLAADGANLVILERAAYQVATLGAGAAEPARAQARSAVLDVLVTGPEGETLDALIFAMDRISPAGCEAACLGRLEAYLEERRGAATYSGDLRALKGLLGRLNYRSRDSVETR
jgi:hypothetical protein